MLSNYKIIFSSQSLLDLQEAKIWYNKQQKGLGKKLVGDIKVILNSIKANPHHASVKYKSIRTSACKIFPYTIHYEIDESEHMVRIISIFHFSRKPKWLE